MAYSTEEIETKAETLLPGGIGDGERSALTAVCAAAQAALTARLREGVTQESLGETFTTACGMLLGLVGSGAIMLFLSVISSVKAVGL